MDAGMIFLVGDKGSGKSFQARALAKYCVRTGRRVCAHDPTGDWEQWGMAELGIPLFHDAAGGMAIGWAYQHAPCTVVFDEASYVLPVERNRATPGALELVQLGRHYEIGVIATTQRPSLCSLDFRVLATDYFLFRMRGERDLGWVAKNVDDQIASKLKHLDKGQYIRYTP